MKKFLAVDDYLFKKILILTLQKFQKGPSKADISFLKLVMLSNDSIEFFHEALNRDHWRSK